MPGGQTAGGSRPSSRKVSESSWATVPARSGPPKCSRFSAALNGYFPNLLAVDGCRDIVIAIGNKLPRPCEIAHRRKLEDISHGKHC